MLSGIDISKWQENVNFDDVKAAGGSFVLFKAGGSNALPRYVDSKYRGRPARARAAGLSVGHYWMNGGGDPREDAAYFASTVEYHDGEPLILDVESIDGWDAWNPDQAAAFLDELRRRFTNPNLFVYMNSIPLGRYDWSGIARSGVRLWRASYGSQSGNPEGDPSSGPWPEWTIWQYAQNGTIGSFFGDTNLAREDAFQGSDDGYGAQQRQEVLSRLDQIIAQKNDEKAWILNVYDKA